jgi:hypothetical protein
MQQQQQIELTSIRPILESDQPLDFWCRKDGENYYLFIAHLKQRKLRYPLEYGFSEKVGRVRVEALFYGNEQQSLELDFQGRGITLRLTSRADRQ